MATAAIPTLNREHIRPGDRICAAVSGGADSVALLLLLHAENALPRNALGVGLSAAHVHHGLRGEEADADLAFVESFCARLGVPLHVRHVDTAARVARSRAVSRPGAGLSEAGGPEIRKPETTEEAARNLRYEFFASLIAAGHAGSVLTAHTLDDQAETVLMKLLRGAWTEGLSGIHPVVLVDTLVDRAPGAGGIPADAVGTLPKMPPEPRWPPNPAPARQGKILRPLLGVRRGELRVYLESRNQPWREDQTNSDEAFTRNRIRHAVLPVLREENPAIDQALANLAVLAREDEARWQSELARILPQLLLPGKPVRGGGRAVPTAPGDVSVAVDLDRLRALDPAARRRVLRAAARQLGARLSFDDTARLLVLCGLAAETAAQTASLPPANAQRAGSRLHLAGGLRGERSPRELRLFRSRTP